MNLNISALSNRFWWGVGSKVNVQQSCGPVCHILCLLYFDWWNSIPTRFILATGFNSPYWRCILVWILLFLALFVVRWEFVKRIVLRLCHLSCVFELLFTIVELYLWLILPILDLTGAIKVLKRRSVGDRLGQVWLLILKLIYYVIVSQQSPTRDLFLKVHILSVSLKVASTFIYEVKIIILVVILIK